MHNEFTEKTEIMLIITKEIRKDSSFRSASVEQPKFSLTVNNQNEVNQKTNNKTK